MSDRRRRLRGARLYLVCDARSDSFLDAALRGGVDIVQLRLKHASDGAIVEAGRRFAAVCNRHGALFILNDRPDLVAATGADGAHVGQDDVPVAQARALIGADRVLGLSTHTPEQVLRASRADVDYIGVGPVHATPTKAGRPAVGLELVSFAAAHTEIPFFAIGGIDPGNAAGAARAGAQRIAVVRALTEAGDPEAVARSLRERVSEEQPVGSA